MLRTDGGNPSTARTSRYVAENDSDSSIEVLAFEWQKKEGSYDDTPGMPDCKLGRSLFRARSAPKPDGYTNEEQRSLRPAIIARKVSSAAADSGLDREAESHSVFSCLFGTLKRRGVDSAIDGILGLTAW